MSPRVWSGAQCRPRRIYPRSSPSTYGRGPHRWGTYGENAPGAGGGGVGRRTPGGASSWSHKGSARAKGYGRSGDARYAGAASSARPSSGRSAGRRGGPAARDSGAVLAASGRPLPLGNLWPHRGNDFIKASDAQGNLFVAHGDVAFWGRM